MESSDGRLLAGRRTGPFDGKSISGLMGIHATLGSRLHTGAWMFGKKTLRKGYFPKRFRTQDTTPLAHILS